LIGPLAGSKMNCITTPTMAVVVRQEEHRPEQLGQRQLQGIVHNGEQEPQEHLKPTNFFSAPKPFHSTSEYQ
jgi:hypothetical protein